MLKPKIQTFTAVSTSPPRVTLKSKSLPKVSPLRHLGPGDRINISVSHALKINGDETWVKYEVGHTLQEDEWGDVAHQRVMEALTEGMDDTINQTVKYVTEKS